jgi:tRNA uridine 5-carboxymethylaminomethyl modification enzyme
MDDLKKLPKVSEFIEKEKINEIILEQAEIQIKYSGYIAKEKQMADKIHRLENISIPVSFNYNELASLSSEAKEKLNNILPQSLSQASRISGINPSDISVLLVALGR